MRILLNSHVGITGGTAHYIQSRMSFSRQVQKTKQLKTEIDPVHFRHSRVSGNLCLTKAQLVQPKTTEMPACAGMAMKFELSQLAVVPVRYV
jgi:hypothetical protein